MKWFFGKRKQTGAVPASITQPTTVLMGGGQSGKTTSRTGRAAPLFSGKYTTARSRIQLYRFLVEEIPVVQACLATWIRMSAAPGNFRVEGLTAAGEDKAMERLNALSARLGSTGPRRSGSLVSFLTGLFQSMYRDGAFAGLLKLAKDGTAIDNFHPVDAAALVADTSREPWSLWLEEKDRLVSLDSPDFYHLAHNADSLNPLGSSILRTVPFVAYIQQQLVDDMRRSSHNAGYHRLHVKVTPPERMAGESDKAYVERINSYFDSTVSMIKSCRIDENPVTWDNVAIDHIGPENVRAVTNSWFMNHRAMIEEICAGTNLAPFMLGYSYGATSTWSSFKFELVMRQVRSVQAEVASFLAWLGNIELALAGISGVCRYEFDNTYAYQALDASSIKTREVDNLLRLFESGLIDESSARRKAGQLVS